MDKAAQEGDIDALYDLIDSNPTILDDWDKPSFANTPLHVAAAFNQALFVKEIINLKPSLGGKLNTASWSPLHLALSNRKWKTARQLVRLNSELIRVNGRAGFTPLHVLATMDDDEAIELLVQFLCDCPRAIEDLTVQHNTVLHIAVKYRNVKAFNVLFEWVWRTDNREVLIWGDDENNTVLHIAAETQQLEARSPSSVYLFIF
ncbi:hypothetical protein NMG60_11027419 [Bertholletia excelsa]